MVFQVGKLMSTSVPYHSFASPHLSLFCYFPIRKDMNLIKENYVEYLDIWDPANSSFMENFKLLTVMVNFLSTWLGHGVQICGQTLL